MALAPLTSMVRKKLATKRTAPALAALAALAATTALLAGRPAIRPIAHAQQRDPDASMACFIEARDALQLVDRTAILLCNGAASNGPVQCFKSARDRTMLMDFQIVSLCRCANSDAPVGCVERGRSGTFLVDDQIVQLCSATTTDQLRANCAPFVAQETAPTPTQ
jgi:hypothetical protein